MSVADAPPSPSQHGAEHLKIGGDYLREEDASTRFERGFQLLSKHDLSFDLQCCPSQLPAGV
jgi:predicted TIM-barrel fold metal-dependent hydrolase